MRSQDDRGERCPGPRQAVRPYQLLRDILVTVASSLALFLTKQINLLLRLRYSLPSRLILVLLSRLRYFLSSRFILIRYTVPVPVTGTLCYIGLRMCHFLLSQLQNYFACMHSLPCICFLVCMLH